MSGVRTNRQLLLPFLLPYLLYAGIASIPDAWLGREANYALRLVVVGGLVGWAWRSYLPLRGPYSRMLSCFSGLLAGMAGVLVWTVITEMLAGGDGEAWARSAYYLRVASAVLLAPIVEEQLIRGYVLRFVLQWQDAKAAGAKDPFEVAWAERSVFEIEPGRISAWSIAISTLVFALGHSPAEYPAAVLYGLLMCGLWHWRRDLLSCVVAHAATNLALAWYVRAYGEWALW